VPHEFEIVSHHLACDVPSKAEEIMAGECGGQIAKEDLLGA